MPLPLPDLQLFVSERRRDGQTVLGYQLKTQDPEIGVVSEDFRSEPLRRDPAVHVNEIFGVIENIPSRGDAREQAGERLKNLGARLSRQLLPLPLRRKLWSLPRSLRTFQIVSYEASIPWELLRLQDPDDDAAPGLFFGEAFALTRWLSQGDGCRESERLPLHRMALVVPAGSKLANATAERQLIKSLETGERRVEQIPARYLDVTKALASGYHDGWHFAGHGLTGSKNPDHWSIKLEDGKLTSADLSGDARRLGRNRPLVFLNACDSAREANSLTGLGGLASSFLAAGAGAFIGSYWAVPDDRALCFADTFYERFLRAELPIGEAVRQARMRLREKFPGDPTWLAYTVFAHPLARCSEAAESAPVLIAGKNDHRIGPQPSGSDTATIRQRRASARPEGTAQTPPEVSIEQRSGVAHSSVPRSPHRRALIAALIGALATIAGALITNPWLVELWRGSGDGVRQVVVRVAEQGTGAGVGGAEVLLYAEGGPYHATTDSNGTAKLPPSSAGDTPGRLVVQATGYQTVQREIQPSPDRLIDVRLSPTNLEPANVLFRVVDGPSGEPIPGAEVLLLLGAEPYSQTTDTKGLAKFEVGFQDGQAEAQISVQTSSYTIEYQRITLRPDTVQDVRLDRRAGSLVLSPQDLPPESPRPTPTHEVVLVLPHVMEGAEIRVDGRAPTLVRDLGIFVTIRVAAKDSNHHIEVRKGERVCSQEIWIGPDTARLQPCG